MTDERIPGRIEMPAVEAVVEEVAPREPGRIQEPVVAIAEDDSSSTENPRDTGMSLWLKVLWMLLITSGAWLLVEAGLALQQLWNEHWWLATGLAVLTALTLVFVLRLVFVEWRASRRLDEVKVRQEQFLQARAEDDSARFSRALDKMLAELEPQYPEQLRRYREALPERESVAARMQLAENTWLAELDKRAEALIKQEALAVGAAVAIIPHPVLDGAIVLWRSQRLIRSIGALYGLQPTGLSSWKLLKMALLNTLVVGAVDTASEIVAEQAGYSVVETAVGKGAVQGMVMNQRMRRLGKQAQALCRPWPSRAE